MKRSLHDGAPSGDAPQAAPGATPLPPAPLSADISRYQPDSGPPALRSQRGGTHERAAREAPQGAQRPVAERGAGGDAPCDGLRIAAEVRAGAFHLHARFAVPSGLTVLFGPSGAGKSLALQALAGLVPIHAGRIRLGGHILADTEAGFQLAPRLRHVGYVPQSYALFPHLTVGENIAYGLPAPRHPWDARTKALRAARVAELLELVRLPGYEQRAPAQLSGGQAQRVALARALASHPEALLLDEPLSALDAPTRASVRDELRAVVLASGVPAVIVTHDLAEARALGDRLVVLIAGHVVAEGALSDVLAVPPSAQAALLLGWRNVLRVSQIAPAEHDATLITLLCGQHLSASVEAMPVSAGFGSSPASSPKATVGTRPASPAPADTYALALRADHLEVSPWPAADTSSLPAAPGSAGRLKGRLITVTDAGAYYTLALALEGAPATEPRVMASCSPREWAALGITLGDAVAVRVPMGAARLVYADFDTNDDMPYHANGGGKA